MKITLFTFAILSVQAAMAGPTFYYTGNALTTTTAGVGNLTANFEFSVLPVDGSILRQADLINFSITAAGRTITKADPFSFFSAQIAFGPNLLPRVWQFAVERNIEAGASPEQWTSESFGRPNDFDAFSVDDQTSNSTGVNGL